MATYPNNIPIPSRKQLGLQQIDDVRVESDIPTLAVVGPSVIPTPQLDWILSTLANLEARVSATDRRVAEHRFPPRPDSAPPYAVPLSTAVRTSNPQQQQFQTAVTEGQFPPQPYVISPAHNNFHVHDATARNRQSQISFHPSQPFPQGFQPPFYGSDSLGQSRPYLGLAPPVPQVLPPPTGLSSQFDRPFYSNLPGPRATSCWYPSADRPPHNSPFQDQPPYGHPPLVDAGFHPPHTQSPDSPDWQQLYRPYDWGAYAARQSDAYQPYTQPAYVHGQPYTWKQPSVEYSYDTAGDFDCLSERRMVEEEHCDKLESLLSTDSRLAIEATEAICFDATNLDTENVSNIVIGLPNDNNDSEENRDGDRTMDDDNFINEIVVDLAHQYGSDNEHSPRRASQAEEGDGDAEINDRNVASDDKAMVDYFAAALAGVSVTLDHSTSALVSIVDAVAALSCDALRADVWPFNLMDSGDGSVATDVVALAADFKVFFNTLKLLNSGKKLSDDSVVEILSLHEDFRDVSRSLHSRARVQLNSRFGVGSVKVLSMALGNLALSRLYLGINSIPRTDLLISNSISDVGLCSRFLEMVAAKRLLPALEELLRQAGSSIKGRNEARELVDLRTCEIAVEVSQVEAAISGLSEEVVKKSEEIESLKKSLLEKEGNVAELGRKSMEKQEGMEGELSRLRLLIFDYESKMEMQRPLLIDQLNYVTRLHAEMSKAMKIDEKRHEVFLDSRIF